eukprot:TRINITY_DN9010_c0_g1_i1.p1 TRINITY_DN9010_c0_g1~~TRINITY_DN9010_c0_g1_i1.p1  ORF type:complete len:548 (-),score=80.85 TRINITY_DN9010_c0_g1_i1:286-1929(-)
MGRVKDGRSFSHADVSFVSQVYPLRPKAAHVLGFKSVGCSSIANPNQLSPWFNVVRADGKNLKTAPLEVRQNREVALTAVAQNVQALRDVPAVLKLDPDFRLAATARNGHKLLSVLSVWPELKQDRGVFLQMASEHWDVLRHASEEVRSDREVVLASVRRYGGALQFASEQLRDDFDIACEAVNHSAGRAIKFASKRLRGNRQLILAAVSSGYAEALKYASKDLRNDREIVSLAVAKDSQVLRYASKALRQDQAPGRMSTASGEGLGTSVSDYAKAINGFLSKDTPYAGQDKLAVTLKSGNTGKVMEEYSLPGPSRLASLIVWVVDATDPKATLDKTILPSENAEKQGNMCVLIMDKTKPVGGAAHTAILHFIQQGLLPSLTLVFKPSDKHKMMATLKTLLRRPEFKDGSMLAHMICFPRLQLFDVVFAREEWSRKETKVLTTVSFGANVEAQGSPVAIGAKSVEQYMARGHSIAIAGLDMGKVLANPGDMPPWNTDLSVPGTFSLPFALISHNFFSGMEFTEAGSEENDRNNMQDLKVEYETYVNR